MILKPQRQVKELIQFVIYYFHLQVIITHGLCHLLGYTHDTQNNLNKVTCHLLGFGKFISRGVTLQLLAFHPGSVEILLVTSYCRNKDKLQT